MPLLPFLGAAAGAVGGVVNSLINRKTSKENTSDTINAQRQLAEYQYQNDLKMWNLANQYNSPEAQMQRLERAGLNPNMVYGSGSATGNTSTQTPRYQMYNPQYNNQPVQVPDLGNVMTQYLSLKQMSAQNNLTEEQLKQKRIENNYMTAIMQNKARTGRQKWEKGAIDLGYMNKNEFYWDSPYFKQSQATVTSRLLDNKLKKVDYMLRKKGVTPQDSLLIRLMTLDPPGS